MSGKTTRKQPRSNPAAVILAASFLFLIPVAVLALALLNIRKTNLLSWTVSAVMIAASVYTGMAFRVGKE